jgi:hypothetical protein
MQGQAFNPQLQWIFPAMNLEQSIQKIRDLNFSNTRIELQIYFKLVPSVMGKDHLRFLSNFKAD